MAGQAALNLEIQPRLGDIVENLRLAELYGQSLSGARKIGELSVKRAFEEMAKPIIQQKDELAFAVAEALSTDKELKDSLIIVSPLTLPVLEGHVMSKDGQERVVDLCDNGLELSEHNSRFDPRLLTQKTRDKNDKEVAVVNDQMVSGQTDFNTRIVASASPIRAFERDGPELWEGIGYENGLHYIQVYYAGLSGELNSYTIAVRSSLDKLKEGLSSVGIYVPHGEVDDNYINYAYTGQNTKEEALQIGLQIKQIAEGQSIAGKVNTMEAVDSSMDLVDMVFEEMFMPMAESLHTGVKNAKTKALINAFIQKADNLKPELMKMLEKQSQTDNFGDKDARLIYQLAIYSVVEMIRSRLQKNDSGKVTLSSARLAPDNPEALFGMMANYVKTGVNAGRSYGSCGMLIDLEADPMGGPQGILGGNIMPRTEKSAEMKCVNCPECKQFHDSVRRVNGKYVCDNPNCKLTDKKSNIETVATWSKKAPKRSVSSIMLGQKASKDKEKPGWGNKAIGLPKAKSPTPTRVGALALF